MNSYTSGDGLNILTYLGLTNLTDRERELFRKKWAGVYSGCGGDLIMTTWKLYSDVLPFTCGDGDRGSFMVSQIRDGEFGERLEESGLDEKLKSGLNLEDIFASSPEKFVRNN